MTIVIERYPVLDALMASASVVIFVALSVWLAVYSSRKKDRPKQIIGWGGAVFWLVLGSLWLRGWSPSTVKVTRDAVELKYLLSTQRIELTEVERVEFEISRPGKRWERWVVRIITAESVHKISQYPEPSGDLKNRPVRRVFDELAARLPLNKVRDLSAATTNSQ